MSPVTTTSKLSLGLAHEVGVGLACGASILLVLLGGAFPVVSWIVLGAPVLAALLSMRSLAAPNGSGTLIGIASIGLGAAQVVSRGIEDLVYAGGIVLLGLMAGRLLTKRTLEHDVQALALSLLLVMAGSVLNVRLSFAPVFVLYGITFVWALTTRQLLLGGQRAAQERGDDDEVATARLRERRDVVGVPFLLATSAVAVVVLLSTLIVFFTFPRIGMGNLSFMGQRGGRFPGEVSLRGLPRAGGGNDVVARVTGLSQREWEQGLYLRGGVYDKLTSQGFTRRERIIYGEKNETNLALTGKKLRYEVFLTPHAGDLLFSLGRVEFARTLRGGTPNPKRALYLQGVDRRSELKARDDVRSALRYQVAGTLNFASVVPPVTGFGPTLDLEGRHKPWLETPDVDPRVRTLVDTITQGAANDDEVVVRLRRHLLQNFTYTLDQPSGLKEDPLTAFLTEDRAGHCEYFAAAFALMLRLKGIPARVVGGYQGGSFDEEGNVVVFTSGNAHAWVEWFRDGAGWVVDDATPVAGNPGEILGGALAWMERIQRFWDDTIIDFSLDDQVSALRDARRSLVDPDALKAAFKQGLTAVSVVGGAVVLIVLWRRRRRQRKWGGQHPLSEALLAAVGRLQQVDVDDSRTHREAVADVVEQASADDRLVLRRALQVLEAEQYAQREPAVDVVERLVAQLAAVHRPKP